MSTITKIQALGCVHASATGTHPSPPTQISMSVTTAKIMLAHYMIGGWPDSRGMQGTNLRSDAFLIEILSDLGYARYKWDSVHTLLDELSAPAARAYRRNGVATRLDQMRSEKDLGIPREWEKRDRKYPWSNR